MCGIAGFVGTGSEGTLREMGKTIEHRGPDDEGTLLSGSVGFAFRRLAIIDTSPAGHQPMESASGSAAIVYNGEIYNYEELRTEVAGYPFKGHSDTEVILALYERDGEAAFEKLRGMFAIALHDRKTGKLFLVRDRMGEKPLYYGVFDETLLFASEPKAFRAHPAFHAELDTESVASYFVHEHVPTPRSIYKNVHKLTPGTCATFLNGTVTERVFWKPEPSPDMDPNRNFEAATKELDHLLAASVSEELVADVPVGVLLSGGLDSSTVAYYAKQAKSDIRTFSVGFDEPTFDESEYARSVAKHLGTEHVEERFSAGKCVELIPEIFSRLDEPLADASILPTYLLSSFVQKSVTVAVGGDGGDELFAGYPTFGTDGAARLYQAIPQAVREGVIEPLASLLPASDGYMNLSFKANRFLAGASLPGATRHLGYLSAFTPSELSELLVAPAASSWTDVLPPLATPYALDEHDASFHNALLAAYERTYLIDHVLVKVDRAAMLRSLETRAPLLDVRVVEFANGLPYDFKWHEGSGKRILKSLMRERLPDGIADRKKKGFGVPMAKWLRGELKGLAHELLAPEKLRATGILKSDYPARLLAEHESGARDHHKKLWTLMVFMLWYDSSHV